MLLFLLVMIAAVALNTKRNSEKIERKRKLTNFWDVAKWEIRIIDVQPRNCTNCLMLACHYGLKSLRNSASTLLNANKNSSYTEGKRVSNPVLARST